MHFDPSFQPSRWIVGVAALLATLLAAPLLALFGRSERKMEARRLIARIARRAARARGRS